ncbi:MAG: preprotein translocase subunit SecE [Clostridia bacterium]|nr:preprotein translocase subunit SecE [Clostridia bacterium]
MTAFNTRRNLLALLLAVVFACSLFTVGAFAEEETTTTAETTEAVTEEPTGEETTGEETTGEETTGDETTGNETTSEETSSTEESTSEEETTEELKGFNKFWKENFTRNGKVYITKLVVWGLVIAGLIAGVVFCIVKKEKVGEFLRALNSEKKRIVWSSWKDTRKNTLVVLAVVAAITLVIFLFNLVLEKIFGGASTGGDLWFEKSLLELIVGLFH